MELTGAGLVISCSQDATLRIWSLDTGALIRVVHNKLHITVTAVSVVTRDSNVTRDSSVTPDTWQQCNT